MTHLGLPEDAVDAEHVVEDFVEQHQLHIQLLFIEYLRKCQSSRHSKVSFECLPTVVDPTNNEPEAQQYSPNCERNFYGQNTPQPIICRGSRSNKKPSEALAKEGE